jgi:hypothetical protein
MRIITNIRGTLKRKIFLYSFILFLMGFILILISILIPSDCKIIIDCIIIKTLILEIGTVLFGSGTIGMIFETLISKDLIDEVSSRIDYINNMNLDKFYENRIDRPHLDETLKECDEVWCIWYTGGDVASTGKINYFKGKKTRLILMKPKSAFLKNVVKILPNEKEKILNQQIVLCTRRARENDIEVKWFNGPIMYSIIMVNPDGGIFKKSFAQIEFIVPSGILIDRPTFVVTPYRGKKLFHSIRTWYDSMWNGQELEIPPKDSELDNYL